MPQPRSAPPPRLRRALHLPSSPLEAEALRLLRAAERTPIPTPSPAAILDALDDERRAERELWLAVVAKP